MKNPVADSPNPDIRGSWPALLRAAKQARELAKATGTPLWIMRNGKIVDALAKPKPRRASKKTSRRAKAEKKKA